MVEGEVDREEEAEDVVEELVLEVEDEVEVYGREREGDGGVYVGETGTGTGIGRGGDGLGLRPISLPPPLRPRGRMFSYSGPPGSFVFLGLRFLQRDEGRGGEGCCSGGLGGNGAGV